MNTILYALAMWALVQLLVVWLFARLAGARQLLRKDYLELQDLLARRGLDVETHDTRPLPIAVPTAHHIPPGVRSSVTVPPCGPLEEASACPLRAPTGCAPRLQSGVAVHNV